MMHELKNPPREEIGLLHLQPSTNSSLHFLITEESILLSVVKQPQEIIVQRRKVRITGGQSTVSH
jgi:hypothetical protein